MTRDRRFPTLLAASTISNLGDGVALAALPLLVATLSRDPTVVAGLAAVNRLPWLLFSLPVGALTDRWDRRVVMWRANAVRFVAVGALATAVAAGNEAVWMLYVAAAVAGTAEVFYDNAAQTILPSLVEPDRLPRANGRLGAAELVANGFVGPPLGAALFVVAVALPIAVDAATFGLAALLVFTIPGRYRPAGDGSGPAPRRLGAEIAEGVRWLRAHDLIRLLALLLALANFVGNAGLSILVLLATDELGLGDVGFGLLLTAGAVGGLAGAVVADRLEGRLGAGTTLVAAYLLLAVPLLVLGITGSPIVAGAMLAAEGFAGMVWNVHTVSARQRLIPDHLLGRVNSVYRLLGWGSIPLGAAAGGVLASAVSIRSVFLVGGVLQLAVGLLVARRLRVTAAVLDDA